MTAFELPAPVAQVAHNTLARTVWVIHPGDEHQTQVSCLQLDTGKQVDVTLPHDVLRFTHNQTLTCLHGNYGASILNGDEVLFSTTGLGPYSFQDFKIKRDLTPDIRGVPVTDTHLGTLELEAYLGTPLAAAQYRGLSLGLFDGPYFSALGQLRTPWTEPYQRPHVLGEIYIHPHSKLISIATPDGWAYSLDDTRSWLWLQQDGWPIKVSDHEVWLIQDGQVKLREPPR